MNEPYPGYPQVNQPPIQYGRPSDLSPAPYQPPFSYPMVSPKSPALACLASFFVPGLGQLLNGDVAKGIAIFSMYVFSWLCVLILIGLLMVPVVFIWAMVDAYSSAQRWNFRHGIIS